MTQRIAYYRVSSSDQTVHSQREALGENFEKEFSDEGISGSVPAMQRNGFSALMRYAREGDIVSVYSIDRLGRDAIDIQTTVKELLSKGVMLEVFGLGRISEGAGEIVLAVLAQVAEMEKKRILERTSLGRDRARQLLLATGKTQNGKIRMGRPVAADAEAVRKWKNLNAASIASTAAHFQVSTATVKRYCSSVSQQATDKA